MSFEKLEVFGNVPLPRFGHSITPYSPGKICLFGGATGTTGQFSITDNTYTLDLNTKFWKKLQTSGTSPSARAAHGAVCIQPNKIVIFGGATGSGGLASDDLFHLDIQDEVGLWNVINVSHKTPGKRYGHTFSYTKPYLVVFGGNIGQKSVNDCWILNIQRQPLVWTEVKCEGQSPSARVYHSAALCQSGTASGMIVVFGGRGTDNNPLGDSWGLRRHRKGHWDWVKAPQKTNPSPRYQHSSIFVGSLMVVIGGRTNNVSEQLPLQVFDTQTSDWYNFNSLQRFRCGTWFHQNFINIYGGFDLATPNVPTDSIYRINLINLFSNYQNLKIKLGSSNNISMSNTMSGSNMISGSNSNIAQKKPLQNSNMQDLTRPNSTEPRSPNTPVMKGASNRPITKEEPARRQFFPKEQMKPKTQKKKRIKMLDPVMGNTAQMRPQYEVKRPLTTKADLPHYFLNQLLQPKRFMNAEAIDIYFKPEHIHHLCNMAQQVIVNQPMILTPKTPLKIFGDIHGQFTDLMSFFELYGSPHENGKKKDIQNYDYVFLGDFVDRGSHSLQTICLLLALKCVYPQQIHLIRGNHEDSQINVNFGFRDQCADKITQEEPQDENSVFNRINRLFDWLPLAALIEEKILCLHGGIGASLETLNDIENIKRPLQVMHQVQDQESQVVLDILWSDPTQSDSELGIIPNHLRDPSQTGNIVKFGPDRVQQFLKKNNLNMIIRAHECVMDGFERFANGSLITVFSATDYCRKHKNAGAILIVKTNYEIIPKLIYPSNTNANNWIEDEQQLRRRPPTPPRWRSNQGRN